MKTLQIHFSIKDAALFLSVFVLLLGMVEVSLRSEEISTRLTTPSFGSDQHQFEIQLWRLKALYQTDEKIDCIFVGDSLTWLDLDPLKFSQSYRERTGKEIKCFNFGVAGLPASGVSVLTKILVEEYDPQLIIYGLHANSLVVSQDHEDTQDVLNSPFVQYKSGNFNPTGWLYEHSYLFRYRKVLNRLLRLDQDALANEIGPSPHQLLGFDPKSGQRIDIGILPSRDNAADINGFEKYYEYHVYPENTAGIRRVAEMADRDTRIVMVIMPVNKAFYAFFENGERDYSHIIEIIQGALVDTDTIFLKANDRSILAEDDWWDYSHLNLAGAEKFSYWLGGEVGRVLPDD